MIQIKQIQKSLRLLMLLTATLAISCETNQLRFPLSMLNDCYPQPNLKLSQFIIGYGSLMEEKSKRRESSQVSDNYPIILSGFKRGWIEPGIRKGSGITFLGVRQDANAKINAVYYKLSNPRAVYNYDKREVTYCRIKVSPQQIELLGSKKPAVGEYWIYVTKAKRLHRPSPQMPILQSYVDLFLSGCFELEEKFHLKNFATNCVKMTNDWSEFWVNDRANPRTGSGQLGYEDKIDHLLYSKIPFYFKKIQIEKFNNQHLAN